MNEEQHYPNYVKKCKCGSEDISIGGAAWIQVWCNECSNKGTGYSYGTRLDRLNEAIDSWNDEN